MQASKGRHPRSRAERQLFEALDGSVARALAVASTDTGAMILAHEAAERFSAPHAVTVNGATRLSSNGMPAAGGRPSLFYRAPPAVGTGLRTRQHPFVSALPPRDDAALQHYGVQQLSEYARSALLGEASDYLVPSKGRARFDALLIRAQQAQLAQFIANELATQRPDAMWNFDDRRFHLAPVTGVGRVIDTNAWAEFIRFGGDPSAHGVELHAVPAVRAERAVTA